MKTHIKIPPRIANPFSFTRKSDSLRQTKASSNQTNWASSSSHARNRSGDKSLPLNRKSMEKPKSFQIQAPSLNTYFDEGLRNQYHKKIIDAYFGQPKDSEECISPMANRSKTKNSASFALGRLAKHVQVSEGIKRKPYLIGNFGVDHISLQDKRITKRQSFANSVTSPNHYSSAKEQQSKTIRVSEEEFNSLPIIEEKLDFKQRPFSQQRRQMLNQSLAASNTSYNGSADNQTFALSLYSKLSENCEEIIDEGLNSTSPDRVKLIGKSIREYGNSFFQTYSITSKTTRNKLKQFSTKGIDLYERQLKIQRMHLVPVLWDKDASNTSYLKFKKRRSLREELYSMSQQRQGAENIFIIYPKDEYQNLFKNNNEWLIDIISGLCKQFRSIADRVVHCKVNINNVYRTKEKEISIDDWGHSAIKQVVKVQELVITNFLDPILGSESNWLAIPEYLPPEMLKDCISHWENRQIWSTPTATNMWFIGCLIFQILTLTPLWIPYRCLVKGQTQMRRGILSVRRRVPQQILRKHRGFVSKATKIVQQLSPAIHFHINPIVTEIMERCLKIDPQQRISPEQAINILKF